METFSNDGRFRGVLHEGTRIFRGIVFARYGRFAPAVMQEPEGMVDAVDYGCVCPQRSSRLASAMGDDLGVVMEEGRLCLSVYAPEKAENLPVMVWIHGGAFLTGGSEEKRYSCERLVRTGNVVVVKISYRLGALGYLYMPERGAVNLGLQDQELALEWVRMHVASFGGNPEDVTLFGQSAGALSIAALIARSGDNPPFRKAVLQSAPLGITITPAQASDITDRFLKALGKDPMEARLDELLDAQETMKGARIGLTFMPVMENITDIGAAASNGLKIVAGYTKDDASPFLKGSLGSLLGTAFGRMMVRLVTRFIFANPVRSYVRKLKANGAEASLYYYDWAPKGNPLGSCHCMELPFLLGEYEDWCDSAMLKGMTRDEFETNSRLFLTAWTRFASEGVFPEI
ncbi:MAG: carboxylesterase/lipase family protein [Bacteroidales bacterium]|nr:carboxylesterase/lipase family protein [Bacteroidales bacterium]